MNVSLPFYVRLALILLSLWLIMYGVYIGKSILLPFGFAFLIAVLLQPVENFFLRMGIPRVPAILITLLIAFAVLFAIITFISSQVSSFVSDVPAIEKNLTRFVSDVQDWINNTFHFSRQQQEQLIKEAKSNN